MKRKITLLSILTLSVSNLFAQGPITLTSANFPILTSYNSLNANAITDFPFGTAPNTWEFGNVVMPLDSYLEYPLATDPFFTGVAQTYRSTTRSALNAIYDVDLYWTKNETVFSESGWHIKPVLQSLTDATGGANDKVEILESKQIFDVGREILKFPATMGSINSSDSRRVTNFNLTIEGYALNNTPGQLVTHLHRHDTIVSYGKMSVYTPNGPSAFYDVLVLKSWQYELDSFYLNGAPAPTALLTAFGLSQGQSDLNDINNRLYFYRENNAAPFMLVNFFDSPFEFYSEIYVHGDNLSMASTEELQNNYNVFIYPNPSSDKKFNFEFFGKNLSKYNYTVYDLNGKIVKEGSNLSADKNKITLEFDEKTEKGTYFVKFIDDQNNVIANEKIMLD